VVEGTGLENRQACKRLVGSNPTPSAIYKHSSLGSCAKVSRRLDEPVESSLNGLAVFDIESDEFLHLSFQPVSYALR
jgi:hypothetical protein